MNSTIRGDRIDIWDVSSCGRAIRVVDCGGERDAGAILAAMIRDEPINPTCPHCRKIMQIFESGQERTFVCLECHRPEGVGIGVSFKRDICHDAIAS